MQVFTAFLTNFIYMTIFNIVYLLVGWNARENLNISIEVRGTGIGDYAPAAGFAAVKIFRHHVFARAKTLWVRLRNQAKDPSS
jgi:hypothetical protein